MVLLPLMKKLIALLCLLATPVVADLSTHAIFKHYIGTWNAAGELKGVDGNVLKISEEWTGKVDGENGFLIEGTRTINGDKQPFKWTITHNVGADSFEAVLTGVDAQQTIRFEGNASLVNQTLELKSITGSGQSSITIFESFSGDAKDVIESKVTFTGDQGQTTLEGVIKHQKEKQP